MAAWALPVPVFPEPSGPYAVGTTVLQWTDPDRLETFTAAPDDHRTVVVQLWYPAQRSPADVERAPNGGRTEQEARAVLEAQTSYFGIPHFLLEPVAEVRTSAVFDAPVIREGGRFPLVVFSTGLTGVRTSNTVLAEEWASRGYVVASLDHTYDAAVTFIDGKPVHTRNKATGSDEQDRKNERRNVEMRVADLGFTLTQLGRLDRGEIPGPLTGRLDTERAAAVGHSRGGATAIMATRNPGFRAVINIDGGLGTSPSHPFDQPALAITSPVSEAENPDYIPTLDRALELGTATNYRIEIPDAGHLSFADAALYFPPLPSLLGTVGRTEGLRITGAATAAFLDATLRGKPSDLPKVLSRFGELTVHEGDA